MAVAETQVYMPPAPRPRFRLLEDERWLAFMLLVPTLALLGMFIAYPFARGILLSVTNSRVGIQGEFVGLANFYKIFSDGIFRTSVYNTFVYTGFTTVFKLALGLWLMGECQFLIPYRSVLIARYGRILLEIAAVLFVNLFGLAYLATRQLLLKDTGRKLAHLRRAWDPVAAQVGPSPVVPAFRPVDVPVVSGFSRTSESQRTDQ